MVTSAAKAVRSASVAGSTDGSCLGPIFAAPRPPSHENLGRPSCSMAVASLTGSTRDSAGFTFAASAANSSGGVDPKGLTPGAGPTVCPRPSSGFVQALVSATGATPALPGINS